MRDEEFIKALKRLQEVKPSEHWVMKTERNILGIRERRSFSFSWSPVLAGLAALLLITGGLLGYHYAPRHQQVAVKPKPVSQVASLAPSLENLKNQIQKTSEGLKQMPASVAMSSQKKEVIKKTVEESQKLVKQIKTLDKDKTLASLTNDITKANQGIMTEFTRQEIQRLDQENNQGLLSKDKVQELTKIKSLLKEGKNKEAFYQLWISGFENGGLSH